MKKLIALHKQIHAHRFRKGHNPLYCKSFGILLRKLILEFYEQPKAKEVMKEYSMFIHDGLSVAWKFEEGIVSQQESFTKYYKDGEEMDKDILIIPELIIGDIHRFIMKGDVSRLHYYYTGANSQNGRKWTTVTKDGITKDEKGWK